VWVSQWITVRSPESLGFYRAKEGAWQSDGGGGGGLALAEVDKGGEMKATSTRMQIQQKRKCHKP